MFRISKSLILFLCLIFAILSCNKENSESEVERIYTKSIERISSSEFEEGLIDAAEKHYPPREDVIDAASWSGIEVPETRHWFYDHFDGVYLPFTITIHAIDFYSDLIDDFNSHKKDNFFLSANFEYKVEVTFHESYTSPTTNSRDETIESEEFSSVYVVKMTLKWENYCGLLCALWINKNRIVLFNEAGELLMVFLDGTSPVMVS